MNNVKHFAKKITKLTLYYIVVPILFLFYRFRTIDNSLVLFADAHNNDIPLSMELLYKELKQKNYNVVSHCYDYRKGGLLSKLKKINRFLRDYGCAKHVFIQDTFLPIAACRKRKSTMVIQLWHGCGLLKKTGYDIKTNDIALFNPFRNYDLVTVSSKECVPVFDKMMKLKPGIAHATGVSRSDNYFNHDFIEKCKKTFYANNPEAVGKKIVIWAPTFRGDASAPKIDFIEDVEKCFGELKEDYYPIIKLHPHLKKTTKYDNITKIEYLLPVAHVLITDYSSILYEYLLKAEEKHLILFTPDYQQYIDNRGLYIDYNSIPGPHVNTVFELKKALLEQEPLDSAKLAVFMKKYMEACDGRSTNRIIERCKIN